MKEKKDKDKNGRWRCPTCRVEADVKGRDITVNVIGYTWPLHYDCEFGKDIDSINFDKLERIS